MREEAQNTMIWKAEETGTDLSRYVLDNYCATGKTLDGLEKELKAFDTVTKSDFYDGRDINLVTIDKIEGDKITGYRHNKGMFETFEKNLSEIKGMTDELAKELRRYKTMVYLRDELAFVSSNMLPSLCNVLQEGYGKIKKEDETEFRFMTNETLTKFLTKKFKSKVKIVRRESGETQKVCSVFSSRYLQIDQSLIMDVIRMFSEGDDGFGTPKIGYYECRATGSIVYVEFPEKAKDFTEFTKDNEQISLPDEVIPGIFIETSDAGKSAFRVYGTMKINGSILYLPTAKSGNNHTLNATKDNILDRIRKKVFYEYSSLPQRLADLLEIDMDFVTPAMIEHIADKLNLESAAGKFAVKEAVEQIRESNG